MLAAACGGESAGPAVGVDGGADAHPPRLADVEQRVFVRFCTFAPCHPADNPQQGLSLVPPTRGSIVARPATTVSARLRVVPGDPGASFLFEKVSSDRPAAGVRMPPNQPLDSDKIELVRAWIAGGAQD